MVGYLNDGCKFEMILLLYWLYGLFNDWKASIILTLSEYVLHVLFAAKDVGIAAYKYAVIIVPQLLANQYIQIYHLLCLVLHTFAKTSYVLSFLKLQSNPHQGIA